MTGSYLWSWQRAQATERPRKARVVTSIWSSIAVQNELLVAERLAGQRAEREKAGGDPLLALPRPRVFAGKQIAGELLA